MENWRIIFASVAGGKVVPHEASYEKHLVTMVGGRESPLKYSVDKQGFQIVIHQTSVTDFYNDLELSEIYNEEIKKLVLGLLAQAVSKYLITLTRQQKRG